MPPKATENSHIGTYIDCIHSNYSVSAPLQRQTKTTEEDYLNLFEDDRHLCYEDLLGLLLLY